MRNFLALIGVSFLILTSLSSCSDSSLSNLESLKVHDEPDYSIVSDNKQGFVPISTVGIDPNNPKIQLGKLLFHDERLSSDNSISCATCHQLALGGDDSLNVSIGVNDARGARNAPSVLNSAHNFRQFWDGRAANLKEQVSEPITNPLKIANDWSVVIDRLSKDDDLVQLFESSGYPAVNEDAIKDAIASYESALITPSDFDRWLLGDLDAVSKDAIRGSQLFVDLGCISCHQGKYLGGNMFQRFGIIGNYHEELSGGSDDLGRFSITQRTQDKYVFKVPSLRNVMLTAPYFHDGSVNCIEDAIAIMSKYQLGYEISDNEVNLIMTFFKTLSAQPMDELL